MAFKRALPVGDSGGVYSSTHTLAAAPRPTRPRNWCSWARPKRSACSMTIRLAAGTSTPTSMTVVATSRRISPLVNSFMTALFSAAFMRPCSRPTITPGSAALSSAWVAVAFCRSRCSLSSTSGQTQYT